MIHLREAVRRTMPKPARELLVDLRDRLAPPPQEDVVQHDYQMIADSNPQPRLSIVLPYVSPDRAFGGITTGIEVFLECGKRAGVDLRILIDDFGRLDRTLVDDTARAVGLDPNVIEIVPRESQTPTVAVRSGDVFVAYNWWSAINVRGLREKQNAHFGGALKPLPYLIQEYEPGFYPFSSAHMLARSAIDSTERLWAIFNSSQLRDYFHAQGHRAERGYTFEPRLSRRLAPFRAARPAKEKQILVYGRPKIQRNCFPSILKGLGAWAERHPEFGEWRVVSAGLRHRPIEVAKDRWLKSLGKLSIEEYARALQTSAVGLSLMSSPHPSYPPLEMAHFGVRTITNTFTCKDLSSTHENIISISDIGPTTIAAALATACGEFEVAPEAGWERRSNMPGYLDDGPFAFFDELARDLRAIAWQ
jgi:O-antigen biosynthesis protein